MSGASVCNGWMTNISSRGQSFDGRRAYDSGAGYFRPPFVGAEKPLIATALEHMGTYSNQFHKGYLNVAEQRGYQGYVSRVLGDHLQRVLLEDRSDRTALCAVQRGIDMYHMLLPPVSPTWNPNGGHGQGARPGVAAPAHDASGPGRDHRADPVGRVSDARILLN